MAPPTQGQVVAVLAGLCLRLAPDLYLRLARSRSPKPQGFGAGEAQRKCGPPLKSAGSSRQPPVRQHENATRNRTAPRPSQSLREVPPKTSDCIIGTTRTPPVPPDTIPA
jgi:hypothetical protein